MEKIKKYFQVKTIEGKPVQSGELVVTPVSQALMITLPYFGITWNRPHEVSIQEGEAISTIRVTNVTRIAQIAIYGIGAVVMMLLWIFGQKSNR